MNEERRTKPREDDPHVYLTVDDARAAQVAGAKFAGALAGAHSAEFALALAEQEGLIQRAITDAGYSAEQAWLAASRFEAAAWDEWERIAAAGGSDTWGDA